MNIETTGNATGFNGGGGGGREDDFAFEQIEDAAERVATTEGGVVFNLNCSDCEASRYALMGTPLDGLFFEPHQARELAAALVAAAERVEKEFS
jgi:hypothetical protein